MEEAKERGEHADANDGALLTRLDQLKPAEALDALDELGLLTGPLLRTAKEVLTYLDRRTYRPTMYRQN